MVGLEQWGIPTRGYVAERGSGELYVATSEVNCIFRRQGLGGIPSINVKYRCEVCRCYNGILRGLLAMIIVLSYLIDSGEPYLSTPSAIAIVKRILTINPRIRTREISSDPLHSP